MAQSNAEAVNTSVVAVPVVDVLFFESDSGTTHLVNGATVHTNQPLPSARVEGETYTVKSMCGRASVEIPHEVAPHDADVFTHVTDILTPTTLNSNPELMNDPLSEIDGDVCNSCLMSWEKEFREGNYRTKRFEM